jgi:hypothetical protein
MNLLTQYGLLVKNRWRQVRAETVAEPARTHQFHESLPEAAEQTERELNRIRAQSIRRQLPLRHSRCKLLSERYIVLPPKD